ncbi:MAG TPA: HsmA family protein [Anaerolineales bacterium]|nr:HsmA family protein [Anaerolineales bacterium]
MGTDLLTAVVCMLSALTLYTVAVWAERFAGRLKAWHLALFWAGLVFDTTGTSLMSAMAGTPQLDFHGITGALGLLFMLGHTLWATGALWLKQERVLVSFHRFSLAVWALWLIAFFNGVAGAMVPYGLQWRHDPA